MKASTKRKRLRKLAKQIVKHEDQFDMHTYFDDHDIGLSLDKLIEKVIEKRRPICGTSGCAAGWGVILFGTKKQIRDCIREEAPWDDIATELLGMTDDETTIFSRTSARAEDIAETLREMADAQ
jgi:hypothetical protein